MIKKTISAGALFSGIGGFCIGFKQQGIDTQWAVENDPAAVTTYNANLESGKVLQKGGLPLSVKDVSVKGSNLTEVDILHAGFPCQSFSVAGDRKGFNDARGQLFYEIIRLGTRRGDLPLSPAHCNRTTVYGKGGCYCHS